MANSIEQKYYGKLTVDHSEKDIVQIWNYQTSPEPEVVQIEKKNIPSLISMLREEEAPAQQGEWKDSDMISFIQWYDGKKEEDCHRTFEEELNEFKANNL